MEVQWISKELFNEKVGRDVFLLSVILCQSVKGLQVMGKSSMILRYISYMGTTVGVLTNLKAER